MQIAKVLGDDFGLPRTQDNRPVLPQDRQTGRIGATFDYAQSLLTFRPANATQAESPMNDKNEGVHNFAVPGAVIQDVMLRTGERRPEGATHDRPAFEQRVLKGVGTQVAQAQMRMPSLVTLWIGANDVLGPIINDPHGRVDGQSRDFKDLPDGPPPRLTDLQTYERELKKIVTELWGGDLNKDEGEPDIVLANIPDVTKIPSLLPMGGNFDQPIPDNPYGPRILFQHLGVSTYQDFKKDFTWLGSTIYGQLLGKHPAGSKVSMYRWVTTIPNPFPRMGFTTEEVLNPTELQAIQNRVEEFNTFIKTFAGEKKIPMVDMKGFFDSLAVPGGVVIKPDPDPAKKVFLDNTWGGGAFSADGLHPTWTAQGLIANKFIEAINTQVTAAGDKGWGGITKAINSVSVYDHLFLEWDKWNPKHPGP